MQDFLILDSLLNKIIAAITATIKPDVVLYSFMMCFSVYNHCFVYLLHVISFLLIWFLVHGNMLIPKHDVKWYKTQPYLVAIDRNGPQSCLSKKEIWLD